MTQLTSEEAQGLLEVIGKYAKSWLLLKSYDEHVLPATTGETPKFSISYQHAAEAITKLRETFFNLIHTNVTMVGKKLNFCYNYLHKHTHIYVDIKLNFRKEKQLLKPMIYYN